MSVLSGKNILVTGANGLVGSHVCEKLLDLKANVVALVRSQNPYSYFAGKKLGEKAILAFGDLKDPERMFDAVTKYEIEYIFHIGAQPIVETAYYNPLETLSTNIIGTANILEAARKYPKIKAIVVASSDKAYGKKCDDAAETEPLAGDHPYDVSKSCTDLIARTYAKTYNLPVAVSRFGNIYGPGDLNFNRIIPGIMKSLAKNEVLELRSDGTFRRDYVYVKDVVDGYICLAEKINLAAGQAFNFSSGTNFSVLELIEKVSGITGKKVEYKIVNNQKNEIPSQSLNFDKARQTLGWQPSFSFEQGIKETSEWYNQYFAKYGC